MLQSSQGSEPPRKPGRFKNGNDVVVAQPLNVVAAGWHRQSLPRRKERHGPGAFAADVVQQGKVVLARHLKLLRNQAAHLPFG